MKRTVYIGPFPNAVIAVAAVHLRHTGVITVILKVRRVGLLRKSDTPKCCTLYAGSLLPLCVCHEAMKNPAGVLCMYVCLCLRRRCECIICVTQCNHSAAGRKPAGVGAKRDFG